jgi:hypothetical protein
MERGGGGGGGEVPRHTVSQSHGLVLPILQCRAVCSAAQRRAAHVPLHCCSRWPPPPGGCRLCAASQLQRNVFRSSSSSSSSSEARRGEVWRGACLACINDTRQDNTRRHDATRHDTIRGDAMRAVGDKRNRRCFLSYLIACSNTGGPWAGGRRLGDEFSARPRLAS